MAGIRWLVLQLLEPQSLWIALGIGCAILAIALIALMVSRWGQAKPIAKCAALSVLAHILLFGFAYVFGVFDRSAPPRPPIRPVHARLIADASLMQAPHVADQASEQPWQKFPQEPPPATQPEDVPELLPQEDRGSSVPLPDRLTAADPVATDVTSADPPSADAPSTDAPSTDAPSTDAPSTAVPPVPPQAAHDKTPEHAPHPPARTETAKPAEVTPLPETSAPSTPPSSESADSTLPAASPATETMDASDGVQVEDLPTTNLPPAQGNTTNPPTTLASHRSLSRQDQPVHRASNTRIDERLLPTPYENRFRQDRRAVLQQYGGSDVTEACVGNALAYFARVQGADGRWDASQLEAGHYSTRDDVDGVDRRGVGSEADTGMTGLALLAMMGAGHTHLEGELQANVQRGLEFLLASQAENGSLAGSESYYGAMYCHGMALLALAEAYALTGDERLATGVTRGVQFTLQAQNPQSGGWRYLPWRQRANDLGDMSQFGWQVMALYSARQAGIDVPAVHWDRMRNFMESCAQGTYGGLATYQQGDRISPTMTGEALLMRFLLNEHHALQRKEAADYLLRHRPGQTADDCYLWYYGTLSLFQLQGRGWETWNTALKDHVTRLQVTDGPHQGSWNPDAIWGPHGGRIYSTALATLSLEVYYRYLPMWKGK